MALIYHSLLLYLLFNVFFCLLVDDDGYQSTISVCSGKPLMANRDQLCGTGEILILKIEAKLHQTPLKLRRNFNTLICSSTVRTNHLHVMGYGGKGREKTKHENIFFPSFWCWLFLCKLISRPSMSNGLPWTKSAGSVSYSSGQRGQENEWKWGMFSWPQQD